MNAGSQLRRWALPLSLAINVFLAAVIGVHAWHHPPGGPPGPPPEHMIEELARILPQADAAVLRGAFASEPNLRSDHWRSDWEDMVRMRQALAAEPFDPAVLEAVLRRGHDFRDAADQAVGRALLKAATAMSPAGRRILADHDPGGPPHGPGGPPPPD